MIISTILITIFVLIFEISFNEISILSNFSMLFIICIVLFWFKRYKTAIIVGIVGGLLVDLMQQNQFGESMFSLFAPILALTVIDGFISSDTIINKTLFSIVSLSLSIFISNIIFAQIFEQGNFLIDAVITRIIYSIILQVLIIIIFQKVLNPDNKNVYLRA